MKRVKETNINTFPFWEAVYANEIQHHKQRVDKIRLTILEKWVQWYMSRKGKVELVDIGCGLGDVAEHFKNYDQSVFTYTGCDIATVALDECKKKYKEPQFHFMQCSEKHLDCVPNDYCNVTFLGETIEHVDEPEQYIEAVKRMTRHDGLIMITTPNEDKNTSPEHVWEFETSDFMKWADTLGKLLYLDISQPEWLCIIGIYQVQK